MILPLIAGSAVVGAACFALLRKVHSCDIDRTSG
jgi:hypothetical protein